ncbi:MAG TPA: sugar-binding transcriptional regulator [Bacillales bacterium]|nr:sugar-binding transcriptional regulator [Bacillales bacterium]
MEDEKVSRLVEIAELYYLQDLSQQEIATKLAISRPTVSRLLLQAKQEGIVEINIFNPTEYGQKLALKVKEKFQLKHCIIAPIPKFEDDFIKEKLGEAAASYLNEIVKNKDVIGITWGTSLYQLVNKIKPKNVKDISIVQLNGGISYSETNTYASEIMSCLADAFNTIPHFLQVPAVVDHMDVKKAMLADRHIKKVLELGRQANIAIYTVGAPGEQSTLMRAGYFLDKDIDILKVNESVGDICSRYFGIDGKISNQALNDRTIGIELHQLMEKEYGILVAGGKNKIDGIYGALMGGYANVLITDQYTAKTILEMQGGED